MPAPLVEYIALKVKFGRVVTQIAAAAVETVEIKV